MRKRFGANALTYQKLHPQKQRIVDAIRETENTNKATLKNIIETYQKKVNQTVDKDDFLENLVELEELGIIRNEITSKQDEPIYTWKAQL